MRHKIGSLWWDCYAPGYDIVTNRIMKSVRESYLQELLSLSPSDSAIKNLLIIGVGTGQEIPLLSQDIHLTGVDFSSRMLKKAIRKANGRDNTILRPMNAENLDFDDNQFHRILMPLILTVVQNPVRALQEAERVLIPGGRLLVYDKFLSNGNSPSTVRRFFNIFSNFLGTNINIDFQTLLCHTQLTIIQETPAFLKSLFKTILLRKPSNK